MGKYDGPHFDCEDEDIVSVWLAHVPLAQIPEDYFVENYDGGDDDPFNPFSDDFGFGYYDIDSVDTNGGQDGAEIPIDELIAACSYGSSFAKQAVVAASKLGIERSSWGILIYNFKYDPKVTGRNQSPYFQFVGAFPYDRTI